VKRKSHYNINDGDKQSKTRAWDEVEWKWVCGTPFELLGSIVAVSCVLKCGTTEIRKTTCKVLCQH